MRPPRQPPPQQQQAPALRVTAITLAFCDTVRDVLVYPSLTLEELQRCIAAGFALDATKDAALPIAVQDPVHGVIYPLSFLTRSPELFEDGTFAVLVQGDSSSTATTSATSQRRRQQSSRSHQRASKHQSNHHLPSKSSSLALVSSDSDSESENDAALPRSSHSRVRATQQPAIRRDADETEDELDQDAVSSTRNDDDDDDADSELLRELDLTDFELPQLVHVFTQACPTGALDRTTFDRCLEKILSQVQCTISYGMLSTCI